MSEITEILQQTKPLPIKEISRYFHEQHSKLQCSDQQRYFEILYSIFSKRPENFSIDDWDRIRQIACIFAIAFDPPTKSLNFKFPKDSYNGYLVSSSFILLSSRHHTPEFLDFLHRYFLERLDSFFNRPDKSSFYDITTCYFFIVNSHITNEISNNMPYIDDLQYIFQRTCQLQPNQLTFSTISFITNSFQLVKTLLLSQRPITLTDDFSNCFAHILDLSSQAPDIFLINFFHSWFFLVKQCSSILNTKQLFERLHTITELFELTANMKYHELHRLFPWYLCFYFYDFIPIENHDQRVKVLSIICNAVRRIKRMDGFPRILESVKMFSISIVQQFIDNNPYDLFYMLSNLNSSLRSLIFQLKKLHAVSKIIPIFETIKIDSNTETETIDSNKKIFKKRQVSFYEQSNWSINSPHFDKFLYTDSYEKTYQSNIECAKDFDRIVQICENIRHHAHSLVIFQIQICICTRKLLSTNELENANTLNLYHYLLNTFSSLIDIIVYTSLKQMEIQSFVTHEVLIGSPVSPQYLPYTQNPQEMLNFNGIFQKYFDECILKMPVHFLDSLALIVSYSLFDFMKKRILSFNFLTNFSMSLQKDYINQDSFINLLLTHMMEIMSKNVNLILSIDVDDVNLLFLWIIFIIRLASPPNGEPNRFFGFLLKTYQRLIIVSVFANLKSISHQSIAVRMVHFYLEAVDFHFEEIKGNSINQATSSRIRPVLLENLEETALLDGIRVIFDICLKDPEFMSESSLIPLIKVAYESSDIELVTKASKICLTIFTPERSNNNPITAFVEYEEQVFEAFMNSISFVDFETASKIVEVLPYYSSKFLKAFGLKKIETLLTMNFENIDFHLILKSITSHLNNSEEEAAHLFALINIYFDMVIEKVSNSTENLRPILTLLINLLKHCNGFNNLKEPMNNLLSYITSAFGEFFIRGESNLYILCVLEVMGINRSESTSTTMKLAASFFNYCVGKDVDYNFLIQTLDSLFTFFPISTKFFSILGGFSLFIKFYPQLINLDYIRSLLIQTSEISPLDKSFSSVLNTFLKNFFEKSEYEVLKKFVSMVYEIICPLSISVRNVIEKRLSKLKIPLPINNLDSIEKSSDRIIMFQKLTLAFLCGIEGDLISCLNQEWIDRIIQFFKSNPNENIHCLQKYVRILSLCLSILKNSEIFKFFISSTDFFNNLMRFLCGALLCHIAPVKQSAKKCFKILKNCYYSDLLSVKMIEDFCRNPKNLFSFWGSQPEKIDFYAKLTKLLPTKIPPEIMIDYFIEVENYTKKSDIEKMQLLKNFSTILKQFTIKEYITSEPVKSLILDDISYLENYIQCILILYQNSMIPFKVMIKKYVMKFLIMFPDQTINIIVNNSANQTLFNYFFLLGLIIDDESNTFFNSFLLFFYEIQNFHQFSPCLFDIFEKLSEIERFAKEQSFLKVVKNGFSQIVHSYIEISSSNENLYSILTTFSISYLNILKYHYEVVNIASLSLILRIPFFNQSDVFQLFKQNAFNSNHQNVLLSIISNCFKSFQNMPLNMLIVLLPYSIKNLDKEKTPLNIFDKIWNTLYGFLTVEKNKNKIPSILKSLTYLIDKNLLNKDRTKDIIKSLKQFITSQDTQTVVYSLKFYIKLAKFNLLPKIVFESIVKQLFSFSKFFEVPYFSYFFTLIKNCPNFIKDASSELIETVSFFFHDRFVDMKDIQKTITVLLISSKLYKILPFSFFISLSNFIKNKLKMIKGKNKQSKEELIEIRDILIFLIPIFKQAETNLYEQKMFHKTCFKYIKLILFSSENNLIFGNQSLEFNEVFFSLLLKSDKIDFPKNLLNLLNGKVNDPIKFCLVCIAAHFEPSLLFSEYSKLIGSTFEYIKNDNFTISKTFLQSFIKFIFNPIQPISKSIYFHFKKQIQNLLNFLEENFSLSTFDKFCIISNSFIQAHFDSTYSNLIDNIFSIYFEIENIKLSSLMFQMILNLIGVVPIDDQLNYIDVITSIEWTLSMKKTFTNLLPSLILCPSLLNKGKDKLISLFPTHVYGTETELLKIIHSVKKYGEESRSDVLGPLIILYIFITSDSSPITRFLCFEKIEVLLQKKNNFKNKIQTLLNILPINLWSDQYFVYIITILADKNKLYYPLLAFADRFKKIASNLAIPLFEKKIDDEIINSIKRFYFKNFMNDDIKINYSQFVRTAELFIIRLFKDCHYNLFTKLPEPYSDDAFLLKFYRRSKLEESYLSRYTFPDSFSDSLITRLMSDSTERQKAAVILSQLCKYEAAEHLFIEEDQETENSYFNCMKKFNHRFLLNSEWNFDSIVRPLFEININEPTILNLKKCIDSIFNKNKEESLEFLKLAKNSTIDSYRNNISPTVYERERLVSLSIIELYIENYLNEGTIPKFNKENLFQCLNPTFVEMVKKFKCLLLNKKHKKNFKINSEGEFPSILISPSIYSHFKEVSGITPHGLFALNGTQINNFFKEISDQISSKKFHISNWLSFAPFCFNVFLAQQTLDCFSTVYNSYCQIVLSKSNVSNIQLYEASARIITLIRIAISLNNFKDPIIQSAFIFKKEYAKVWHVWLQQLVEMAKDGWFFDIAFELFTEMAYRSTLYASKFASKEIQDALHNAIVNEHSFVQISMMNKIARILNQISSIRFDEIELQKKIQAFINEALKLNEEQILKMNLMEIRHRRNFITPFEIALSKLTKSEIEKIGNFSNWISMIRELKNNEREIKIQEFTNSSKKLSFLLNEMGEVIDEFNEQMPFIFPIRGNEINSDFSIFVIHKDIKVIAPEMSVFSSSTSNSSKQYFLIMKKVPNGFRPSVITINHLLSLIRSILRSSYSTIARSITLAENYCFEIGSNTILKRLESEPISLKTFFERDMMITQEDWIKENIETDSLNESENGKLNKFGIESIQKFPHDSLLVFLKNSYGPKSCIFNPHGIAVSYGSISLIRYIMSAPYPDMNMLIMCAKSLNTPVLSIDFNDVKMSEETSYSNFRFSPSIEHICNIWGDCGIKIEFAAISNALVDKLELFRTHLEVILGDGMLLDTNSNLNSYSNFNRPNFEFSIDEMIRQRTIIENRFIALAPPNYISSEEDSYSWLNNITDLIEKAKNPWIQPARSIPWY